MRRGLTTAERIELAIVRISKSLYGLSLLFRSRESIEREIETWRKKVREHEQGGAGMRQPTKVERLMLQRLRRRMKKSRSSS